MNSPLTLWDYSILATFVVAALYFYGSWGYDFFSSKNVKNPKARPFVGNLGPIMLGKENFPQMVKRIYKAFPDQRYHGVFEFMKPVLWIRDPEIIRQVAVKDFEHFVDHRHPVTEVNADDMFNQSLFSLRGQKWRDMRATLSPAFTGSKMRGMFPFIAECSHQVTVHLEKELKESEQKGNKFLEIDTKELFTRYANDVIATCAFGIKVDSLGDKNNEFYEMGKNIMTTSVWLWIKFLIFAIFPNLMKRLKVSLMREDISNFFRKIVRETMKTREAQGIFRPDMIHLLMEAKKGSLHADEEDIQEKYESIGDATATIKRHWTDDELTAQAFVFFLAGFETSSTLMTFAAYELAANPDIQERLRNDIDEVMNSVNGLTYESLMKMKYLDMFISETLRLWPPVLGVDRQCVKTYTLPSPHPDVKTTYQVNVGDVVFFPIRSLQRDPLYFPDPEKLDPERFSNENKNKIPPFTYMPFGAGPRLCIGSRFALMEAKLGLIQILSKFVIVPCSRTDNPDNMAMKLTSLIPSAGMWVGLEPRTKQK